MTSSPRHIYTKIDGLVSRVVLWRGAAQSYSMQWNPTLATREEKKLRGQREKNKYKENIKYTQNNRTVLVGLAVNVDDGDDDDGGGARTAFTSIWVTSDYITLFVCFFFSVERNSHNGTVV